LSEEKRFTNKKLIAESIILVLFIGMTGILGFALVGSINDNTTLSGNYDDLYIDYLELSIDFNQLSETYLILTGEHIELENDYNALVITLTDMTAERDALVIERDGLLQDIIDLEAEIVQLKLNGTELQEIIAGLEADIEAHLLTISGLEDEIDDLQSDLDDLQLLYDNLLGDYQILFDANVELQNTYDALLIAYDYICNAIRQTILPVQLSIFAEAVRRYYMPLYLEGLFDKDYWMAFAGFCRDIILHDSFQYNVFSAVSNAFSDALVYGNDTQLLTYNTMVSVLEICDTINHWDSNYADDLIGIDAVVQDCINHIDYEYDSDITLEREYFDWDYIKFPVETAFRTMGDCEDQAILAAAYLESCGYETAIAIHHDFAHPTLGAFYHGSLLVYIEDTSAFWALYPTTSLWNVPVLEGLWCWIDTTWDVPFGSTPSWLQDYIDYGGLTTLTVTVGLCDIGGTIGTNIGENTGLTYVMPT